LGPWPGEGIAKSIIIIMDVADEGAPAGLGSVDGVCPDNDNDNDDDDDAALKSSNASSSSSIHFK
jgi:hypothetical protein